MEVSWTDNILNYFRNLGSNPLNLVSIIIDLAIVLFLMQFAKLVGLDLIESFKSIVNSSLGISIFLIVGQVFYMLNFSSIIAISRDSNNAILIKFLPIDLYKQFKIKIRIGILINTLASLIVSIAFLIFTKNLLFTFIIFLSLFGGFYVR